MSDDINLDVPDLKVIVDKPDHYHILLQSTVYNALFQNQEAYFVHLSQSSAANVIVNTPEHYHTTIQSSDNKVLIENPEQYLVQLSHPNTAVIGLPLSAVFAISSSYALTGSYAITSSYSVTSSYAENAGASFPYTGSAQITGSVGITGSLTVKSGSDCILHVDPAGMVGVNLCNPQYALHVSGAIFATDDVTAFSDRRVKTDIVPIYFALSKVQQMQGVTFKRINDPTNRIHMGFIAQDVQEILPEVVVGSDLAGYGVSYGNITAVLVEAVKELKKEIDELKYSLE
jgi:hypothetical protein